MVIIRPSVLSNTDMCEVEYYQEHCPLKMNFSSFFFFPYFQCFFSQLVCYLVKESRQAGSLGANRHRIHFSISSIRKEGKKERER